MDGSLWIPRAITFSRASKAWMLPKPLVLTNFSSAQKFLVVSWQWAVIQGGAISQIISFILQGGAGATRSRGWKEGVVLGHQVPLPAQSRAHLPLTAGSQSLHPPISPP